LSNTDTKKLDSKKTCLFLSSFGSRFGGLTSSFGFLNGFDDTDGDGLPHISDSEPSERSVLRKGFDTHRLGGDHLDDASITRLDFGRVVFQFLTGPPVDFLEKFREFAGDVSGVAIQNWGVTFADLTRVVKNDDLSVEAEGFFGGVVLRVGGNVTPSDVFDGDVFDVETNVVTWLSFWDGLVVHLNGFDLGGDVGWGEGDDHTGFDGTGFDTTDWHSSDTTDLVDILEWETEGLVGWPLWWDDSIESFEESLTRGFPLFGFLLPTFVPRHVGGGFNHVVTVPA